MSKSSLPPLSSSPKITPPCIHFEQGCGGCAHQDIAYENQLRAKAASLAAIYGTEVPVIQSPEPLGYRSRMDYIITGGKIGLRARGDHRRVIDTPHCLLLPEYARPLYLAARAIIVASGLPDHNHLTGAGHLKYLVVRTSVTTRETMLVLTTGEPADETHTVSTRELLRTLAAIPGVTSAWWTVNAGIGDKSVGEPREHVGAETITSEIAGARLRVGPKTFGQGNETAASDLFSRAIAHAQGRVLDLCCGTGALAILAAKRPGVTSVIGVDVVDASIVAARENARDNAVVDRTEFRTQDLTEFLRDCAQQDITFDTVICDPARPGLGAAACALLVKLAPARIIYISCNPLTHRQDLAILGAKYDISLLEGHDLFPQTPHVEILSVLARKHA